ncbi:RNA polymerase II holoenzyme cyclin-like subunit [Tilletia horrida]|nr:RNA polymerase II holoenzyme cyclin-like subunit [Tilletia horrida]
MAADYWRSSQCNNWAFTHEQLALARLEDARFASALELGAIGIWIGNTISNLCKRLVLRQRVTATATVFARRFYAKNAYCATEPCLVCAGCVYVAAKVEEMPIHIKQVVTEAMRMFAEMSAGKFAFPSDRAILAEMEFYLIEDLEFDLIIHHPYRALVSIYDAVGKDSKKSQHGHSGGSGGGGGAGGVGGLDSADSPASSDVFHLAGVTAGEEMGSVPPGATVGPGATVRGGHSVGGIEGLGVRGSMIGPAEWAARTVAADAVAMALQQQIKPDEVGKVPYKLDIFDERVFEMAWPILNDVYRTEIPLLYPPYLIALGAICLALVVQEDAFQKLQTGQISIDLVATAASTTPRDAVFALSSAPISVERVQKFERQGREIVEEAEVRRAAEAQKVLLHQQQTSQPGGKKHTDGGNKVAAAAAHHSPSLEMNRRTGLSTGSVTGGAAAASPMMSRGGPNTSSTGVHRPATTAANRPGFSPVPPHAHGHGIHAHPHMQSPVAELFPSATPGGPALVSAGTGPGTGTARRSGGGGLHPHSSLPPRPGHLPPRPSTTQQPPSGSGSTSNAGASQGLPSSMSVLHSRAQPVSSSSSSSAAAAPQGDHHFQHGAGARTPGMVDSPAGLMTPPALPPHHHNHHLHGRYANPASTTAPSNPNTSSLPLAPRPNPLGPPTDPPPHPLVLFLSSLNLSLPHLASVLQEMVSAYELWHACRALVDDGRGMLGLLEGMREKRAAAAAAGGGEMGGGSMGGGVKRAREG